MWIARDKNGALWAYDSKPIRNYAYFITPSDESKCFAIFNNDFKDVTWDNSPKEIKCCPSLVEQLDYHFKTTPKEELDKEYKEISEKYPLPKEEPSIKISVRTQNIPCAEEVMAGANPTYDGYLIDIPIENIPKEVIDAIDKHSIVSITFIKE